MTKIRTKNEQGITLVALIITIIVLIILAAVSIVHMLNLQIIGQAVNGTQDYSAAQYDEKNEMENIANMIESTIAGVKNNQGGGKDPTPETPPTPPVELPEVGTEVPTEGWSVEVAKGLVARDGIETHLGEKVDYNPPAGGTWRIFYYDNEDQGNGKGYFGDPVGTVYLRRDYDSNSDIDLTGKESYSPLDNGAMFYQHNPLWKAVDNGTVDLPKERVCSFLTDTTMWEDYVETRKSKICFGSSTELRCFSLVCS